MTHWSRTQAARTLSVADSEYHAIFTGERWKVGNASVVVGFGAEGRGQNMDGLPRGESDRVEKGLGLTRRIELRCSWVQEITNS